MPLQYQDLLTDLLQYNTTLQIGRRDRKVSELDMKIARAALFPKLDFDAGYNYNRTKSPASVTSLNRSNGPYWGFSLSVDIFNRLENRRKIRNAKLDMENAALSYQEAEQQVKADLAQLYNTYENNLQIVSFEEKANGLLSITSMRHSKSINWEPCRESNSGNFSAVISMPSTVKFLPSTRQKSPSCRCCSLAGKYWSNACFI